MSRVSSTQAECTCGEVPSARPADIGELLDWNARREGIQNILWFGCIDAAVSEKFTSLTRPEGIITHRNFGNLFKDNDPSTLAALSALGNGLLQADCVSSYAILVVGHDNCQAIQLAKDAVAGNENIPVQITNWIEPLIELVKKNPNATNEELSRLNVNQQTENIRQFLLVNENSNATDEELSGLNVNQQAENISPVNFNGLTTSDGGVVVWGAYYNINIGLLRA